MLLLLYQQRVVKEILAGLIVPPHWLMPLIVAFKVYNAIRCLLPACISSSTNKTGDKVPTAPLLLCQAPDRGFLTTPSFSAVHFSPSLFQLLNSSVLRLTQRASPEYTPVD